MSEIEGSNSLQVATEAFLESWDRHVLILGNLCNEIGEEEKDFKAAPDGSTLGEYLCHIHECRYSWLKEVSAKSVEPLGAVYTHDGDTWMAITDLNEIKKQLDLSGKAVGDAVRELIDLGTTQAGPYDHPAFFLQHMLWHESGHFGVMTLAFRVAGQELDEEWEEENVWGVWRKE